jgi:hypothetical protein
LGGEVAQARHIGGVEFAAEALAPAIGIDQQHRPPSTRGDAGRQVQRNEALALMWQSAGDEHHTGLGHAFLARRIHQTEHLMLHHGDLLQYLAAALALGWCHKPGRPQAGHGNGGTDQCCHIGQGPRASQRWQRPIGPYLRRAGWACRHVILGQRHAGDGTFHQMGADCLGAAHASSLTTCPGSPASIAA